MKLPRGQGIWPASMLGDNLASADWPVCGEIMENIGREPSIVHGTLHGPGYSGAQGPTAAHNEPVRLSLRRRLPCLRDRVGAIGHPLVRDGQLFATRMPSDLPGGAVGLRPSLFPAGERGRRWSVARQLTPRRPSHRSWSSTGCAY